MVTEVQKTVMYGNKGRTQANICRASLSMHMPARVFSSVWFSVWNLCNMSYVVYISNKSKEGNRQGQTKPKPKTHKDSKDFEVSGSFSCGKH